MYEFFDAKYLMIRMFYFRWQRVATLSLMKLWGNTFV